MLDLRGKLVKVGNDKRMDYWEVSKKEVSNWKKLIEKLKTFDKDNVQPHVITNIQKYLQDPDFVPDKIKNASEAAEGICKWVIAICKYDVIYKEIQPKREERDAAQAKLAAVVADLNAKRAELEKLQA